MLKPGIWGHRALLISAAQVETGHAFRVPWLLARDFQPCENYYYLLGDGDIYYLLGDGNIVYNKG